MQTMAEVRESRNRGVPKLRTCLGLIGSALRAVLVCGICCIILYPLLVHVFSSFMEERDLFDHTVKWIARNPTLENYRIAFRFMNYPIAFLRTFGLSVLVSGLQLVSCTMIGYGLAKYRFPGNSLLFALVVFMLLVPPHLIMIPLYLNFRFFSFFGLSSTNLLGTYWPFVLMSVTGTGLRNGLCIYIMRQFFKGMPNDLREAAYVDGCGHFRTFAQVMLPNAIPAMVVVFLFSFVWQWNDSFYTQLIIPNSGLLSQTLQSMPYDYNYFARQEFGTDGLLTGQYVSLLLNTGSMLLVLPLLVLYAVMQRYFIESVERVGLVG